MSSKPILYFTLGSPPARAAYMLAKHIGLDFEVKNVDLMGKENYGEEYTKINPVQKVPVLIEGDYVLAESRAIMAYLVNSRKPGSELYPTDPKLRGLVDQRLYYDATVVFKALADFARFALIHGEKRTNQAHKDEIRNVLKTLNGFLDGKEYFAGSNLTIADISILASVSSFDEMGYSLSTYPNLASWYERLRPLPIFAENLEGAKLLGNIMRKVYEDQLI